MPVDRPTFSESWYRVGDLRPRLRSTVQVSRQHFRGRMWHVVQDPASNQFFRLNEPAYRFVGMLDGRRTVAEVWRNCNEQLGDDAPTQGEAIQLLGQLYASNLLQAELAPDAEGLLKRYRKRKLREVRGYMSSLLFARIPLFDPDRLLDRWVGVLGAAFTWVGLVFWSLLIATGIYFVIGRAGELTNQASAMFDPEKLPLLYVSLIVVKIAHEFGHAVACKTFGRRTGSGGEVHVMGVMFLVFAPLPYVDASSAWAFRSKWRRIVVGAGGMIVELGIAAVAAVVWASTTPETAPAVHGICYNIMFIASVSSLLFNGNPLLRYDSYYILSDLLEIPNLAQRSKEYLYYLVKRYVWGVRQARSPAHTRGERGWFAFYGVASTAYRLFIFAVILLFLSERLPKALMVVAIGIGLITAGMWLLLPLGKLIRYLASNGELARVRSRAVLTTLVFVVGVIAALGTIRVPDRGNVEGIVEPVDMAVVYAGEDGFVAEFLPSGQEADPNGAALVVCESPELRASREQLLAERRRLEAQRRIAQTKEPAAVQVMDRQLAALAEQIRHVEEQLDALVLRAPLAGTWISPDIEYAKGAYLRRGDRVGMVVATTPVFIRVAAGQDMAGMLSAEARKAVEIRIKGRPDLQRTGRIEKILQAGQEQLPSAALGYAAGGALRTASDDPKGMRTAEKFFEIRITPDADPAGTTKLWSGQRVVVRFEMPDKPLLAQWYRSVRQLFQRRFRI